MYNNYEEYMREVLGYPYNRMDVMQNSYEDTYRNSMYQNTNTINTSELESCYPEIYKIVRPMVKSTCEMYSNQTITQEILEEMTMKIYMSIETNENRSTESTKSLKNGDVVNPNAKLENREDRVRPDNFLLRDLIKILILNELLRGGSQRPPHHQMPPRPQFPPFGGNMPSRPQMRLF